MAALEELTRLAMDAKRAKYPTAPLHTIPRSKYRDNTAASLTICILHYIRFSGGYAVRINSQGQYQEHLGKWTKSTTTRGTADIHATLDGKHISIEVKVGQDRQSVHQVKTQQEIEQAGGLYVVARNFQQFYEWVERIRKGGANG